MSEVCWCGHDAVAHRFIHNYGDLLGRSQPIIRGQRGACLATGGPDEHGTSWVCYCEKYAPPRP